MTLSAWCKLGIAAALCAMSFPSIAAPCEARSAPYRVSVLELYTSEGCSSCPPADRWLSALPQRGIDSSKLIALAFHVDYWNELGWPDRFSQATFSERQRQIAERLGNAAIYTPQLLLDGADLRLVGGLERVQKHVASAGHERPGAQIELNVEQHAAELSVSAHVNVVDAAVSNLAQVWIAIFENDLSSSVARGENAGKQLHHDYVVRSLVGPFAVPADGRADINNASSIAPDWNRTHLGVAVLVQRKDNGRYLQAASTALACR